MIGLGRTRLYKYVTNDGRILAHEGAFETFFDKIYTTVTSPLLVWIMTCGIFLCVQFITIISYLNQI